MPLDKSDINKIAWLARIAITEAEIPTYLHDVSNIIAFMAEINSVDTDTIKPLTHPLEINAVLRPDKVTEMNQREYFQKISLAVRNGHYLAPKVIK